MHPIPFKKRTITPEEYQIFIEDKFIEVRPDFEIQLTRYNLYNQDFSFMKKDSCIMVIVPNAVNMHIFFDKECDFYWRLLDFWLND